jgi:hypothetical protein
MEEKAALEYLIETGKKLSEPIEREYEGRKFINKELRPIEEPLRAALKISTLGSLVELCVGKFGPGEPSASQAFEKFDIRQHVLHVINEEQVQVVSAFSNVWAKREMLIDCKLDDSPEFPFGQYMNHEDFMVKVLSLMKQTEDRDYMLRIASSLTAERVVTSDDDGISQGVGLKAGVSLKTAETLKNRVKLAPFRTFREVAQPISEFVFRVKQDGDQMPKLALFEADGGAWKLEARDNIARFLSAGIPGATVAN